MLRMQDVDEILDFAIRNEEESHRFYMELAESAAHPDMKETFRSFAKEELGHKRKLEALKAGRLVLTGQGGVQDLRIGDYLVEEEPHPSMDYEAALVLAMKKEKAAFKLYTDLASMVEGEAGALLLALAQEEAKHKLRFELEYDDHVLREN